MAEEVTKTPKSKKRAEAVPIADTPDFDPLAGLTEQQLALKARLEELAKEYAQNEVERSWLSDMCILRYLRARDWKLEKAEKMLKATLDWRREWKADEITRDDVIRTLELRSLYRNGKDKLGRPVMFIKPSYNGNTVEYRLRSLIYSLEECIESMDAKEGVEKMTIIADFETENKLEKKSPDQNTVARQFLGFLQNHYPERLAQAIALNPPWYIRLLFTIISPFMDPVTKKKIHFINGDAEYVKKELLQYIEEDQLESCYGGSRPVEPEPDCRFARQQQELNASSSTETPKSPDTPTKQKKKKKKNSQNEASSSTAVDSSPIVADSSSTVVESSSIATDSSSMVTNSSSVQPNSSSPSHPDSAEPSPLPKKKSKKSSDAPSPGKDEVVEVE